MLRSIEILRIIGLLAVVVIHANAFGSFGAQSSIGFVADELSRFAVPCFFVISGFFWRREAIERPWSAIGALFVKLAPIYVVWVAFYFAVEFSGLFYPRLFGADFHWVVVIVSGGPGIHLWFLAALFMGAALCWLLMHYLGSRVTLAVAVLLYVAGVLVGCYGNVLSVHPPLVAYRNGIVEAPLFLLAGYYLKTYGQHVDGRIFAGLAVLGLAAHVLEGLITGQFPLGHDYSFGTILAAVGLVGLFVQIKGGDDRGWGRDVLGAYLIHLFILKVAIAHLPWNGAIYAFCLSLAVAAISLAVSRLMKMAPVTRRLVALG